MLIRANYHKASLAVLVLLLVWIDVSVADALQVSLAKTSVKGSNWKGISVWHDDGIHKTKLSKTDNNLSGDLATVSNEAINDDVHQNFAVNGPAIMTLPTVIGSAVISVWKSFRRCWWCLPMLLAFVPVYSSLVLGTVASMPKWWPLTRMDHILNSPYAKLIIGFFLGSNISYFISGSYLLLRETGTLAHAKLPKTLQGYPLLGVLVLTAGFVSTCFHTVQALGSFKLAEMLCYIDHAVAISAIFYFWHRCGKPSRTTTILSAVGFGTLVVAGPHYAFLHSAWHFLSATAAVVWAHDGYAMRLAKMELPQEVKDATLSSS